jgi:cyclophilin family peptidyl-prolyl cis-trans isomerase
MSWLKLWDLFKSQSRKPRTKVERRSWRRAQFEPLEERQLLTVNFSPVQTQFTTPASKDLLIPLTSVDSLGGSVTYSVSNNSNAANVATSFVTGGTTIVVNVSGKDGSNQDFSGDITVRLFDSLTPNTVLRLRELISQSFYNGQTFHRVLGLNGNGNGMIAQGGDPTGFGADGSGTAFDDEYNTSLTFNSPGLLGMAKSSDDTNSSQFFFVNADAGLANSSQHLNFNYTILGQVVAGFDTLNKVMHTPKNSQGQPTSPMQINSVRESVDIQDGILRVDPGATYTGTALITVIATSTGGATASQTFNVTIAPDTVNEAPFLNPLPVALQGRGLGVAANTPFTFDLSATDLENDALTFQILDPTTGLTPTGNVTAGITGSSVTLNPANGFVGTVRLRARVTGVGTTTTSVDDTQDFTVTFGNVPSVSVAFSQPTINEDGGSAMLVASLSSTSSQPVVVNLGFGGTAIYHSGTFLSQYSRPDFSAPVTITIPAGQLSASVQFNIADDTFFEADETVTVNMLAATNALIPVRLPTSPPTLLTIVDNDASSAPLVSLDISPQNRIQENGGSATITARTSHTSSQTIVVQLSYSGAATQNTDFAAPSSIVIQPGQTAGSVTLRSLKDYLVEADESVAIDIQSVSNGIENGSQQVSTSIDNVNDANIQIDSLGLHVLGTAQRDVISILMSPDPNTSSPLTSKYDITVNGVSASVTAQSMSVDGLGGNDTLTMTVTIPNIRASLKEAGGFIETLNSRATFANLEQNYLFVPSTTNGELVCGTAVETVSLTPSYAVVQGPNNAYLNQIIGAGRCTASSGGSNDTLIVVGDNRVQSFNSLPGQTTMTSQQSFMSGQGFGKISVTGGGGDDTAFVLGAGTSPLLTVVPTYTVLKTNSDIRYFMGISQVVIDASSGGTALLYDTSGNDSFSIDVLGVANRASVYSARTKVDALNFSKIYAFQYFGGKDTATINVASNAAIRAIDNSVFVTAGSTFVQTVGVSNVNVTGFRGTGGTATIDDSAGNDSLMIGSDSAEISYASGRRVRIAAIDSVFARANGGGLNRRVFAAPASYTLKFEGLWV